MWIEGELDPIVQRRMLLLARGKVVFISLISMADSLAIISVALCYFMNKNIARMLKGLTL